jgi:hypothetical protein
MACNFVPRAATYRLSGAPLASDLAIRATGQEHASRDTPFGQIRTSTADRRRRARRTTGHDGQRGFRGDRSDAAVHRGSVQHRGSWRVDRTALFDSHLGTLTSVTISEGGSLTGSALLENEAPQPESFTFHIAGTAGVDLISSDPSAAAADLKNTIFNLALTSQSYNLAKVGSGPSSNANYGPFSTNWVAAISGLPIADFQQVGGGFVPLHIDVGSFPSDSPMVIENNDVFYDELSVLATASLQARYEYIPVTVGVIPEPSVWALMLLGVTVVGAGLRTAGRKADMALPTA